MPAYSVINMIFQLIPQKKQNFIYNSEYRTCQADIYKKNEPRTVTAIDSIGPSLIISDLFIFCPNTVFVYIKFIEPVFAISSVCKKPRPIYKSRQAQFYKNILPSNVQLSQIKSATLSYKIYFSCFRAFNFLHIGMQIYIR